MTLEGADDVRLIPSRPVYRYPGIMFILYRDAMRGGGMVALYLPSLTCWKLCQIVRDVLGKVTVKTYDGFIIDNLRKRPITGAWICER